MRLTVAILLASGVLIGKFSARVAEDGCGFHIAMTWSKPLINLNILHRE